VLGFVFCLELLFTLISLRDTGGLSSSSAGSLSRSAGASLCSTCLDHSTSPEIPRDQVTQLFLSEPLPHGVSDSASSSAPADERCFSCAEEARPSTSDIPPQVCQRFWLVPRPISLKTPSPTSRGAPAFVFPQETHYHSFHPETLRVTFERRVPVLLSGNARF